MKMGDGVVILQRAVNWTQFLVHLTQVFSFLKWCLGGWSHPSGWSFGGVGIWGGPPCSLGDSPCLRPWQPLSLTLFISPTGPSHFLRTETPGEDPERVGPHLYHTASCALNVAAGVGQRTLLSKFELTLETGKYGIIAHCEWSGLLANCNSVVTRCD